MLFRADLGCCRPIDILLLTETCIFSFTLLRPTDFLVPEERLKALVAQVEDVRGSSVLSPGDPGDRRRPTQVADFGRYFCHNLILLDSPQLILSLPRQVDSCPCQEAMELVVLDISAYVVHGVFDRLMPQHLTDAQ